MNRISSSQRKHCASLAKKVALSVRLSSMWLLSIGCATASGLAQVEAEKETHAAEQRGGDAQLKGTIRFDQAKKHSLFDNLDLAAIEAHGSDLERVIRDRLGINSESELTTVGTAIDLPSRVFRDAQGNRRMTEKIQTSGSDYYEVRPNGELRFIATYKIDHQKNDSVSLIAACEMPAAEQLKHYGCCNSMLVIIARAQRRNQKLDKRAILNHYYELRRQVEGPNADLRKDYRW